jgi:hypothetical protein
VLRISPKGDEGRLIFCYLGACQLPLPLSACGLRLVAGAYLLPGIVIIKNKKSRKSFLSNTVICVIIEVSYKEIFYKYIAFVSKVLVK